MSASAIAPRVGTFRFTMPSRDEFERLFADYLPGQYVSLRLYIHGPAIHGPVAAADAAGRTLSLASPALQPRQLLRSWTLTRVLADSASFEVSVKDTGGSASSLLHSLLSDARTADAARDAAGVVAVDLASSSFSCEVVEIAGDFIVPPLPPPLHSGAVPATFVYVAGGIGITPVWSMVNGLADAAAESAAFGSAPPELHVVHIDRSLAPGTSGGLDAPPAAFAFEAALRALIEGSPDGGSGGGVFGSRSSYVRIDTRTAGRPDISGLLAELSRSKGCVWRSEELHAFVCGPPAMMAASVTALSGLGVSSARLHYEDFSF
jgi:ferredoxin-NADP reductase